MPRARKETQPVRVPTGNPYGEAKTLGQAQAAAPLPQMPSPEPAPAQDMAARHAAAIAAAPQAPMPQQGLLAGPTQRPMEPVQAGLANGPGPGPEALGAPPGAADAIRQAARMTGDSNLDYLADIASRLKI